ncbi:unnamed protein product [Protopolystoma xenopodis]|uniref:UspA domain-containing protein n=1 Tax=Protopolystoma xenopodis TaxID=117903 RepID=A0A3S5FGT1_9PLAT|nr:unnamed protein product [Protopolystoma xenopodis]
MSSQACDDQEVADPVEVGSTGSAKRKIVMPVDSSENSERAFYWYVDNMFRDGDGLFLIHVVEPSMAGVNYGAASKSPALSEEISRHVAQLIDTGKELGRKYIEFCRNRQVPVKFTLHIGTKPGQQIVRIAEELGAHMVIVGNRGIGTLRRTFLGSVSDHILHHVSMPVIVVPPLKDAKKK